MPLVPGNTRDAISANIRELTLHGTRPRSRQQIAAIAYAEARRTGGGKPAPKGSRFNRSTNAVQPR